MKRESLLILLALSISGPASAQVLLPGMPAASSEVRARLSLTGASPQSLSLLLHASPDARLDGQGTYYALQLSGPSVENGGVNARLSLVARSGNGVTVLGETLALWTGQDADVRFIYTADSRLLAYINGQMYFSVRDQSVPPGQAGYANNLSCPAEFSMGYDDTPPGAVPLRSVAYVNRVDLQWDPAGDGNGSGVWAYEVQRDGVVIARTDATWYSDGSVPPGAQHVYAVYAIDYFGNRSAPATATIDAPQVAQSSKSAGPRVLTADTAEAAGMEVVTTSYASGITDGRRVGIRATGSYWGAGGEQIDTLSGNLNYTFPLLKAVGRGSWSVTFSLSYNSQLWRQDAGGTWKLGADVGYSFGWQLMAGSLTPKWDGGVLAYYEFRDSTGAEYRLDQYNAGVWTSREGIYAEYVESTQRLYFPDGSFWSFGCISGGTEQDAGTRYPTLMQDTNGNQVFVRYHPAIGTGTPDTSARIKEIEDVRGKGANTYTFAYNADAIPHMTGITQIVGGSAVMYQLDYISGYNVTSPFDGTSYGTTSLLSAVCDRRTMLTHGIGYNSSGSGELTSVTMPHGGTIRWDHRTFAFSGAATIREVQYRYVMSGTVPGPEDLYTFYRDDVYSPSHNWTVLSDPTGAAKVWAFYVDPGNWYHGLLGWYEDRIQPWDATGSRHQHMGWTPDAAGNPYISAVNTYLDYATASQVVSRTEQSLDAHGNVLQTRQFDYGNLSTPVRTYTNTYLTGTNYSSRHIWNRLVSTNLSDGTTSATLVTNAYDQGYLTDLTGLYEHDTANYPYWFRYRGNVTQRTTPGKVTNITFDIGGSVVSANDGQGHTVAFTQDATTNYAAPTVITPNSAANLATRYSYNPWIAPTSVTTPAAGTATATYDPAGRPVQTRSIFGLPTSYSYWTYAPHEITALAQVAGTSAYTWRHTRTTVDGLGRTVRVTVGTWDQVHSIIDTEYAPCACSPLGKIKRVSQPYAPGGTPIWTTYNYDAFGRTTSVEPAGGGGAITYTYQGDTLTVTDAAGKWKKYRNDALGNLVQVTEPAPEGDTHETYYEYNLLGELTQVTMPRGATTQTRTFNYDLQTGRLLSTTNPENGTISYTHNADGTLATKTDAKGQRTEFTYDQHQRVTIVKYFIGGVEQTCQRVNYAYAYNGTLSQASWGGASCPPGTFTEYLSLSAGRLMATAVQLTDPSGASRTAAVQFGWNNEGHIASASYPQQVLEEGTVYQTDRFDTKYDILGRPVGLTRTNSSLDQEYQVIADYVKDVTYDVAGAMTGMKYVSTRTARWGPSGECFVYNWYTEARSYNARMQLTRLTATSDSTLPGMDVEYRYSPDQNNGRITQMKDWVTGEEVVYQYDSLNRLVSAVTTGPEWGLSFNYDGFGNLVSQVPTKGTAPALYLNVDAGTNRITTAGFSYDSNGNLTSTPALSMSYDAANRMVSAGGETYQYDPWNRKVWSRSPSGTDYLHVYGQNGELMGDFRITRTSAYNKFQGTEYVYFAGRRIMKIMFGGEPRPVVSDRLESVRVSHNDWSYESSSYYPYGEARTGSGPMFATYPRSTNTNLHYAQNRWYSSQIGRFTTPDPYRASASLANPQSWNRYAYVENDPVNNNDPSGLMLDPCAEPENADNPTCVSRRGQPGYWGVGWQSFWNGEYLEPYPVSIWIPTPARGGSRGGSPRDRDLLPAALSRAIEALTLNESCLELFGNEESRANGFDPSVVLTSIVSGAKFGSIRFETKPAKWGVAQVTGGGSRVTLTVNSYDSPSGVFWNDGDADQNAHTLLHELGHAFDKLTHSGSSVIKSPDWFPFGLFGGDKRSRENDWIVDQNCFGGMLGYPKP